MPFWRAFNIFIFLLKAREWYVIADNEENHIKDASIKFGKFIATTEMDKETFVNQEILLDQAKELLK